MLETINMLIGLSVVLLVVSMAVTLLTQIVVNLFLNLRGRAMCNGVKDLLVLTDRGIGEDEASAIADHVLRDPLIAQVRLFGKGTRLAPVVHREELTKLLIEFGMDPATEHRETPRSRGMTPERLAQLQLRLRSSLRSNGIPDPAQTLRDIRLRVMELERAYPELSNGMRANMAILYVAESDFVGKINGWFDQTADRASDHFTARSHLVTLGIAMVVAFVLQLDAFSLMNRLSTDQQTRDALVTWAVKGADAASAEQAKAKSAGRLAPADPETARLVKAGAKLALTPDLVTLPQNPRAWIKAWRDPESPVSLLGVLLTGFLLSLGGPFWYEALKNLLKLRSLSAVKDDAARNERQTTQPAPAAAGSGDSAPSSPLPPELGGEQGDLLAVG